MLSMTIENVVHEATASDAPANFESDHARNHTIEKRDFESKSSRTRMSRAS